MKDFTIFALKLIFIAVIALFIFNLGLYLLSTPSNIGVIVGFLCCLLGLIIGVAATAIIIKNYLQKQNKNEEN